MKFSTPNVLAGTVREITKGSTTAHVKIAIGEHVVTAAITNDAVEELGLAEGKKAYAVVKASDIMVAVD